VHVHVGTGAPRAGVQVRWTFAGTDTHYIGQLTDGDGHAVFELLPGVYDVKAFENDLSTERQLTVEAGQRATQEIVLPRR
jgi:hypothetical protein